MKRNVTRILCLILCLTFLIAEAVPALGASSASDIQKRLEAMSKVSKYRDATYTSFNGKGWGSGCYSFTYALSMELFGVGIPPQKKNSDGYKTLLQTNGDWKEIGVAYSNDEVKTLLKSAQAGDIIQYRSDKTSPHHIKMVYSVTSTELKTWGSSGSAGASFQTYSWNKIAGGKPKNSKWSIGLGDFSPKGNGLSLYRCTKDVRTGTIGDNSSGSGKLKVTVTFSNYKTRKLTETSAEPYATATATNGKVARVGMFIGESKNSMIELGTDNGTPKTTKNMWYNTTKYGYPLEPGTTYYYQPYAEVNGKRYDGDIGSFTTPGEKYVPEPDPEPIVTPEPEPEPIVTSKPEPEPIVTPEPDPEPSTPPADTRTWQDQGWTSVKPVESETLRITDTRSVTDREGYTTYTYYHYWAKKDGKTKMSYGNTYWKNYEEVTVNEPFPYHKTYDGKYKGYKSPSVPSGKHGTIWWLKSQNVVPTLGHTEYRYEVLK